MMRGYLRNLRVDLQRALLSKWLIVAILGTCACWLSPIWQDMQYGTEIDVMYLLDRSTGGTFSLLILVFAALPGVSLFSVDDENKYTRFLVQRSSKGAYAWSKLTACVCSVLLTVALSVLLFIFALSFRFPFSLRDDFIYFPLFYGETPPINVWKYFIAVILANGCCCVLFSVIALWASTRLNHPFVILSLPIISYYLLMNIVAGLQLPVYFQFYRLGNADIQVGGSYLSTMLYTVALFGATKVL